MNVDFPGFGTAEAFWLIMAAMVVIFVAVLAFFRWRRFF
jgi:Mg2+ and Co2+ transporter CorA